MSFGLLRARRRKAFGVDIEGVNEGACLLIAAIECDRRRRSNGAGSTRINRGPLFVLHSEATPKPLRIYLGESTKQRTHPSTCIDLRCVMIRFDRGRSNSPLQSIQSIDCGGWSAGQHHVPGDRSDSPGVLLPAGRSLVHSIDRIKHPPPNNNLSPKKNIQHDTRKTGHQQAKPWQPPHRPPSESSTPSKGNTTPTPTPTMPLPPSPTAS